MKRKKRRKGKEAYRASHYAHNNVLPALVIALDLVIESVFERARGQYFGIEAIKAGPEVEIKRIAAGKMKSADKVRPELIVAALSFFADTFFTTARRLCVSLALFLPLLLSISTFPSRSRMTAEGEIIAEVRGEGRRELRRTNICSDGTNGQA